MTNFNHEQASYIALSSRSIKLFNTNLKKSFSSRDQSLRSYSFKSIYFACIFAIMFALLGGTAAHAQLDQGTLAGTVHDSTGAAIPNATVTLVNEATRLSLVRSPASEGTFTFTPIKIASSKI